MNDRVYLCLDQLTCRNPDLVGLDGETLDSQPWLDVFAFGEEARRAVDEASDLSEVWVASCDDVAAVNLAATLKSDRPDIAVRLVSGQLGGSLLSRAHSAGIDEVIDVKTFVRRYGEVKGAHVRRNGEGGIEYTHRTSPSRIELDGSVAVTLCASGPSVDADMADAPIVAAETACSSSPEISHSVEAAALGAADAAVPLACAVSGAHAAIAAPSASAAPVAPIAPDAVATCALPIAPGAIAAHASSATPVTPVTALAAPASAAKTHRRGFLMPVVSGSGGAGKSTVAVMAALIARDMGYRTLLLDYDLQFGDVAAMAGVENPLTVDAVLSRPDRLEQEISREPSFLVLAAPDRLEKAESVVQCIPSLLDAVADAFDVVVANTGAAWAEQHAVLLERSYVTLFLVDQRASSIRACKHALELCARCGIATGPFEFALNRCTKSAPLTTADVSCALQGVPVYELRDGGRDVEDYLGGGAAEELLQAGNDFCDSLRQVMERILPGSLQSSTQESERASGRSLLRRRPRHTGRKRNKKA